MSVNFNELLARRPDEAAPPSTLPAGTYTVMVVSHEYGTSAKKGTPYVQFNVRPVQPHEDVDMDVLNEIPNWREKTLRETFYLTTEAEYRLADFLKETLGISIDGRTFSETIPEAKNAQYVVTITHRMPQQTEGGSSTRPPQPFAEISARAKAE